MAIAGGASYYQVPGAGAIKLTFPDVGCLFQRTPAKLAIEEKRVPESLLRLCPTVWKVKIGPPAWRSQFQIEESKP